MENGEIKYLLSEERFTNIKNQGGFPQNALEYLQNQSEISLEDLDHIIIGGFDLPVYDWKTKNDIFHIIFSFFIKLFPRVLVSSNMLISPFLFMMAPKKKRLINQYCKDYNLNRSKIRQVEHHTAHAYSALYGSGYTQENEPILIFTIDNSGDGVSSTVSTWNNNSGFNRIHKNQSFNSLGELYSKGTELLGMKPGEHEYKIMGMSPYVSDEYSENVFKILLNNYFSLDRTGLKFINKASHGSSLLKRLRKNFTGYRFDNICAGLQRHFEYVVIEWVKNWAKDTKIKKAVFAGGCFMNVKTNKLILELDIFDKIFFMPSCGDESISIGAAYKIFEEDEVYQSPLNSLCKGQSFSDRDVERTLEKYPDSLLIKKCNDIEREIVSKLIDYKIVGRFKGKEEFGARALGNRSILCRPDDLKIIHKLNKSIKMRDFWMPFAASIIEEDMERYINNPKGIPAPYMTLAFETTNTAYEEIIAGLHPFDRTCRPHIVNKDWNPDYYRLIKIFKEKTGIGALLNTSFNLHGYPIVGTPDIAIQTFLNSRLNYIAIEDYLISKK